MEIQVIEKTNGRINIVTGTTIKERLRVCAYCRVSTDNEEQLNSYQSQLKYYDEKINSKSEWQFAGIYADEAISGTLDFKRTNFMKMIQDAMEGKIDMILTTSISSGHCVSKPKRNFSGSRSWGKSKCITCP